MDSVEAELHAATNVLTTALRRARGLDRSALERLRKALKRAASEWSESSTISKSAANLLIGLIPSLDNASYAYEGAEAEAIRQAADELTYLVFECVRVDLAEIPSD